MMMVRRISAEIIAVIVSLLQSPDDGVEYLHLGLAASAASQRFPIRKHSR